MVKMVVENEEHVGPVWNVIGTVPGALPEELDRPVVLGNHRDAWVFGAVGEPCSDRGGGDRDEAGVVRDFFLCYALPRCLILLGSVGWVSRTGAVAARLLRFWAHVWCVGQLHVCVTSDRWQIFPEILSCLCGPRALLTSRINSSCSASSK